MTNYPTSQDNNITLPGVSGISQEDIAIEALRSATFAIEKELGIVPSGVYSDVRARLDILESRINSGIPSNILNDGYILSPLILWNDLQGVTLTISDGYGAPTENRVNGSLYMRADGYANNDFYIRRDGYWVPIQTEAFIAAGDLMGNHLSQTVIGLYGKSLNPNIASVGATQDGYHLTWNNVDGYWEAQTGFIAASDLAADSAYFGRIGQRVVRLQNRTLSSAAPGGTTASNGDALVWNPIDVQWQPQVRAVIFDGYTTRTNVRSNRTLQSPIDNTKVGIVNFGNSSVVVGGSGTLADYSAILSGDKNTASANFNLVVGGESNITSTGAYASVLNGLQNNATGQYSTVLNGNQNTASALQTFIADGYSNIASAARSFVINGGNNNTGATFSHILNGISNVINTGATHAHVDGGSLNTIYLAGIYSVILGGSGNRISASNTLVGPGSDGYSQSNYTIIGTGLTNTISTSSQFSVVLNGTANAVSASTNSGFIGTGNNHTITGSNATILNGNTNSVSGAQSTIINGSNNTISGPSTNSVILDGYNNTVTASGGFIADGYSNTVSGIYSSIINGNNNSILGGRNTILNGSSNSLDATSNDNAVMFGVSNTIVNTLQAIIAGHGNAITNVTNTRILGNFNNTQSNNTTITGNSNTIGSGGSANRVFGDSNVIGTSSTNNNVFGQFNNLGNTTVQNLVIGQTNTVALNGTNNIVLGTSHTANANAGMLVGQFGKTNMFGQMVQANYRFTGSSVGQAQYSRLVLAGNSVSGSSINVRLQDGSADGYPVFADGFSYDMQIRVLVVNTAPISPNPVVPARFVFDVLAHCEGGVLVLDNINYTTITPNTSDDPTGATRTVGWTVSLSTQTNQLRIIVDPELDASNYVRPSGTPSDRRAIATIDMREITRL